MAAQLRAGSPALLVARPTWSFKLLVVAVLAGVVLLSLLARDRGGRLKVQQESRRWHRVTTWPSHTTTSTAHTSRATGSTSTSSSYAGSAISRATGSTSTSSSYAGSAISRATGSTSSSSSYAGSAISRATGSTSTSSSYAGSAISRATGSTSSSSSYAGSAISRATGSTSSSSYAGSAAGSTPGVPPPGTRARQQPVVVAHRAVSWWVIELGPHWTVPCSWQGQPLGCEYVSTGHAAGNATAQALLQQAGALVNEDCWEPAQVPEQYRALTQVLFSMEPDTMLPCHKQQVADAEMTYRSCSQVWSPYWGWFAQPDVDPRRDAYSLAALRRAPLATQHKRNAIVYINSNCEAASGRQDIMRQLQALLLAHSDSSDSSDSNSSDIDSDSRLTVHSYGACDPNMPPDARREVEGAGSVEKTSKTLAMFRRYKFCVTMENGVTRDYVSEKLYNGLVAGCVPIYLGASNVADFIPDDNAIVNYAQLGSPQALKDELERLAGDDEAYAAKLAWKTRDVRDWNPGFPAAPGLL